MAITPVDLTDTFDVWRTRTNQIITLSESTNTAVSAAFTKANAANVLAFNTGIGANAFATDAAAGANAYMISVQNGSNTAVGTGANAFASATIAGANAAVGAGANAYTVIATTGSNNYILSVIAGANTAVGTGANAFASATISGANTAVGTGANTVGSAAFGQANSAQTIAIAAFTKANDSSITILSDTVDTKRFISFLDSSSGSASSLNVSTSSLFFNPSSRTLTSNNMNVVVSLGVGTAPSGTTGEIRATNDITAYFSSDIRLKTNITQIQNALDKIKNIRGVEFDWVDEYLQNHGGEDGYFVRKHDVGVIAQEIEKVLPEVVAERDDGIKAVKYDRVVALLIEAVKELADQVKELKDNNK
jgi:hypothetical protein